MDCGVAQELISSYIDGELNGEETRQLEVHIENCSECRQRLERMKAMVRMVGELGEEELPDGFLDRLQARLEAEQVTGTVRRQHKGVSGWIKWASIAAAAAVIILAIKVLGPDGLLYTSPKEDGQADLSARTESAAPQDMSESLMADSSQDQGAQDEGTAAGDAGASDAPAADAGEQQESRKGDFGASGAELGTTEEALVGDAYIKSDRVELTVQDVCITPQTILMRALQHGMDMVDQTQDSITLEVTSVEQRRALYQELKLLGTIKEVGTNFESYTVTVVIVEHE